MKAGLVVFASVLVMTSKAAQLETDSEWGSADPYGVGYGYGGYGYG